MSLEEAISMEPIAEKLRNLYDYLPDQSPEVYEFGLHLASRVSNQGSLVPLGFALTANLMIYDLAQGVDGFSNEPIKSSLTNQPPVFYNVLTVMVPKIAEAVCPKDFAEGVKRAYP